MTQKTQNQGEPKQYLSPKLQKLFDDLIKDGFKMKQLDPKNQITLKKEKITICLITKNQKNAKNRKIYH